jgi:chromosome partitioning protein
VETRKTQSGAVTASSVPALLWNFILDAQVMQIEFRHDQNLIGGVWMRGDELVAAKIGEFRGIEAIESLLTDPNLNNYIAYNINLKETIGIEAIASLSELLEQYSVPKVVPKPRASIPQAEPALQANKAEPAQVSATEPAQVSATEPAVQVIAAEATLEAVAEPVVENETKLEPEIKPKPEAENETTLATALPEPQAGESEPEPVAQVTAEPVAQVVSESVAQVAPEPEPVAQVAPEPEPVAQVAPEPKPVAHVAVDREPQPVAPPQIPTPRATASEQPRATASEQPRATASEQPRATAKTAPTDAITLAVVSPKGGVGKTTMSLNLALLIAKQGYSVILVDTDPQGGISNSLITNGAQHQGIYDILMGRTTFKDALKSTRFAALRLLPAGRLLPEEVIKRSGALSSPELWQRIIGSMKRSADVILIDTPAGVQGVTTPILAACDQVLAVSQPDPLSLRALPQLGQTLDSLPQAAQLCGVVLNMISPQRGVSLPILETTSRSMINQHSLLEPFVPRHEALVKASGSGSQLALSKNPEHQELVQVFEELTLRVLERVGLRQPVDSLVEPVLV